MSETAMRDNRYEVMVAPSNGDATIASAKVSDWEPFNAKITVWSPDLKSLADIIDVKARCNDADGVAYNAGRMFDLCEALGNRAMYDSMSELRAKHTKETSALYLATSFFCVISIYRMTICPEFAMTIVDSLAAITFIAMASIFFAFCNKHKPRLRSFMQFFSYREDSFASRKGEYVKKIMKRYDLESP